MGKNSQNYKAGTPYRQPVYNSFDCKIGEIVGNRLVKRASISKHLLHDPRGWAIDIVALNQAEQAGVTIVEIIERDTRRIYSAPLVLFWTEGIFIDRGYGEQRCLPLQFWTTAYRSSSHARRRATG